MSHIRCQRSFRPEIIDAAILLLDESDFDTTKRSHVWPDSKTFKEHFTTFASDEDIVLGYSGSPNEVALQRAEEPEPGCSENVLAAVMDASAVVMGLVGLGPTLKSAKRSILAGRKLRGITEKTAVRAAFKALKDAPIGGRPAALVRLTHELQRAGFFTNLLKKLEKGMTWEDWLTFAITSTAQLIALVASDGTALLAELFLEAAAIADLVKSVGEAVDSCKSDDWGDPEFSWTEGDVHFYQYDNCKGDKQSKPTGRWDKGDLRWNDEIRSLQVPLGKAVTLYGDEGFQAGPRGKVTINGPWTGNISSQKKGLEGKVSSLIVEDRSRRALPLENGFSNVGGVCGPAELACTKGVIVIQGQVNNKAAEGIVSRSPIFDGAPGRTFLSTKWRLNVGGQLQINRLVNGGPSPFPGPVSLGGISYSLCDGALLSLSQGVVAASGKEPKWRVAGGNAHWVELSGTVWLRPERRPVEPLFVAPNAPRRRQVYSVASDIGPTRVDVLPTGAVFARYPEKIQWLCLDGVTFVYERDSVYAADPVEGDPVKDESPEGGTRLDLPDGVVAHANGYGTPVFHCLRDNMIVRLSGLVKKRSGAWQPNDKVLTVPAAYRPSGQLCFPAAVQGGVALVEVMPSGEVFVRDVPPSVTDWMSLTQIVFV